MRLLFQWIGAIVVCYTIFIFTYDTIYLQGLLRPSLRTEIQEYKSYTIQQGIMFPNVVLAQMIHESDWFKSPVFKDHNNIFGMTCHKWGIECNCNKNNRQSEDNIGYCDYIDVNASIRDYAEWQQRRFQAYHKSNKRIPTTERQYLRFLIDVHYATDKNYLNGVKKYISYASTVQ